MRAKRLYIVLSFHATVEAMAWEKHCTEANIPGPFDPACHGSSRQGAALRGGCCRGTGSSGSQSLTEMPLMELQR